MPRLVNRTPSYRKHRASSRAVVTLDGQDIYLGDFGTQVSRDEYDRVIKERLANGRRLPGDSGASDLYVSELLAQFWEHAKTYYRRPDGTPTSEVNNFADVIRVVRKLYGRTFITDFAGTQSASPEDDRNGVVPDEYQPADQPCEAYLRVGRRE
jgi:hypothetical protein